MTAARSVADWHAAYPGRIAGSVYAAPPADRVQIARELADADLDVHVDLMADDEGLPAGVGIDELRDIAGAVDPARVGVQLIGSPCFVDAVLPEVLAVAPVTVFLPWNSFTDSRIGAVREAGAAAWIAVWDDWDGFGAPQWPARPDGVLVMLIEPGTAGACRTSRLDIAAACAAELPVVVDGGVTEDIAPLCIEAGVRGMVVGRALLAPAKGVAP